MLKDGSTTQLTPGENNNKSGFLPKCLSKCFSGSKDDDDAIKVMPAEELPRENSWQATALLILMDDIGTGVLSVPYAFAKVGVVPGLVISIGTGLISWYTGILLCHVIIEFPDAYTMGALAEKLCGPCVTKTVHATIYFSIFAFVSYYLLVCAKALQDISWMCVYSAAMLCILFVFPFSQFRTLGTIVTYLGILSFVMISLTFLLCLIAADDYSPHVATSTFAMENLWDFLESTTACLLAYSGKNIYTEIIYEMKEPKESPKAMHLAYSVMIVIYSSIGFIGYYLAGALVPAYFLTAVLSTSIKQVASVALLFHVLFTIVLNMQVMARALHLKVDPASVDALHRSDENYWRAVTVYFFITLFFFILGFLVMNTIPYFSELVELLGAVLVPLHGFVVPMYLYWLLGKKRPGCTYTMYFAWFLLALFVTVVTIFGTYDALDAWLNNSAYIWSCDP